jgi:hypothetical protein
VAPSQQGRVRPALIVVPSPLLEDVAGPMARTAIRCTGIMTGMATSSKRASPTQRKQPGRLSADPSEPFLRFYHSKALRKNTLSLLDALEQAQDATAHRDALANVIVELTNSGMDAYFMKPLKLAKAGFIVQQSATIGLAGVQQVMGSVIRGIVGRMDRPQLLSVCGSIRQLMI